jgi:hypothetical protein
MMNRAVPNYQATQSFRLFGQACFGVVIGVLVAVALARLLLPPDGAPQVMPEGLLPWNLHNIFLKPREKGFYLLALVLGGAFGYFETYRIVSEKIASFAIWPALLVSIPLTNRIVGETLVGQSPAARIFANVAGPALIIGGLFVALMLARGRPLAAVAQWPSQPDAGAERKLRPFLLLLVAMTLILIPSSFEAVAAKIGLNFHPVSFVFGPALYFLGRGLLPGIDYYSQYSLGVPWLFHFVMGNSADEAVVTYTIIVILAIWAFYAHLIYLLGWLYRSWPAAGLVALIPLILAFCHPADHQAHFFGPSNTVLRYPLLTVCAVLTGLWSESPGNPVRMLAIAAAAAVSIFLETESGIIMTVTAPLVLFMVRPWRASIILPVGAFLAATIVLFIAAIFAVFGPGALQPLFFQRIFDAFLYFGASGFSGLPINWTLSEWNWLYHLVAPGAMLATLGVITRASGTTMVDRRRTAVLGFLALSGLLLLFKFVNQSVTGVWQMSAIGPFSVLGWWCVALLNHIDPAIRLHDNRLADLGPLNRPMFRPLVAATASLRNDVVIAMIVLVFIFLLTPSERRNPGTYGLRAWAEYPSLLRRPFLRPKGCARMECVPDQPAASDIALIDSRMQPAEQTAIVVDSRDWTYLIGAHRPPLLSFLPSVDIFTEQQLQESLRRLQNQNYIFTPKNADGGPNFYNTDFTQPVTALLGTSFEKDGEGDRLIAWKRRAPQQLGGAR